MEAFLLRPARPAEKGARFVVPFDLFVRTFGTIILEFMRTELTKMRWDILLWLPADPRPYLADWRARGITYRGQVLYLLPERCKDFNPVVRMGSGMAIKLPPCNTDVGLARDYEKGFFERATAAIEMQLISKLGHVPCLPSLLLRVPVGGEVAVQMIIQRVTRRRKDLGGAEKRGRFGKFKVPDMMAMERVYVPVIRVVGVRDEDVDVFVRTLAPFASVVAKGRSVIASAMDRRVHGGRVGVPEQSIETFLRLVVTDDLPLVWAAELRAPPPGRAFIVSLRKYYELIYGWGSRVLSGTGVKECILKERGKRGRE